jgi:hypothetical protein
LSDYSEQSGSLVISFSILIVGAISIYGSIRETIDYFAEDIERLLNSSLNNWGNNGYSIESNIQEQYNQDPIGRIQSNQQILAPQSTNANNTISYDKLLTKIKTDRILIGFLFFILLLLIAQNYFINTETSKNSEIDEHRIKDFIKEALRDSKIDEHLNIKSDTIYVNK